MKFFENHRWKVFVLIIVLYVVLMIGMGINMWHFAEGKENISPLIEVIKFELIVLGGLGIVLPAYLSATQSILDASQKEDEYKRYIIENTMSLIGRWDDSSLLEARMFTRKIKDVQNKMSPDDIRNKIENDEGLRHSVILVFNYFDQIRISLKTNRVDKELIKECLKPVILDISSRFKPWLDKQPQVFRDDIEALKAMLS